MTAPGRQVFGFGEVEGALSRMHGIRDDRRTAFQARLKNFHRLGFPDGFVSSKGKASRYPPGAAFEMALAVEMTQLGLSPEVVIGLVDSITLIPRVAVLKAAADLSKGSGGRQPPGMPANEKSVDPEAVFLCFDPSGLRSLSGAVEGDASDYELAHQSGLCYVRSGDLGQSIVWRTTGSGSRIAIINVTNVLHRFAWELVGYSDDPDLEALRREFFEAVEWWAVSRIVMRAGAPMPTDEVDRLNATTTAWEVATAATRIYTAHLREQTARIEAEINAIESGHVD